MGRSLPESSSTALVLLRPREESDARRVTVEKVLPTHRTDLPLRKKAGDRNRPHSFLDDLAVVMAMAEESFSPATTAEQERP